MILDGCHFQYGNFNSSEHGVIFAHCNTKSYDNLMGNVSSSYLFNRRDKVKYIIADNYEDSPITFDAEIISDDFRAFSSQEERAIEKSLFNKPDYRKLYVDINDACASGAYEIIDGQQKMFYFNCRFRNPIKLEDGSGLTVGYQFSIECDSCMAWQDAIEKTFTLSGGNEIITVQTDTDIGGYTYPEVTINIGSTGGDIIIVNTTDDESRLTKFNNLTANISLIMKGNFNYVSGQNYEKFEHQNFIRLLDGNNSISITGDVVSIKFKWRNRRFL